MRVAETILNSDVNGSLRNADLTKPGMWKQTLASLSTVALHEDFSSVAYALGQVRDCFPVSSSRLNVPLRSL